MTIFTPMSCKKNNDIPTASTPSSRRVLQNTAIKDLNGSQPGPCKCVQADCGQASCCPTEEECECSNPQEKETKVESCSPKCEKEVEAMIDAMHSCQSMIRSLAHKTLDILDPNDCCTDKQNSQTQVEPSATGSCSGGSRPDNQIQLTAPVKHKCDLSSDTDVKLQLRPALKSPIASRKSSAIAQTAHLKTDGRLGKKDKCGCDEEKKKNKCPGPKNVTKKTLEEKPSECKCDGEKVKVTASKSAFPIPDKKPSLCKCDAGKSASKVESKCCSENAWAKTPSSCDCPKDKKKKDDSNKLCFPEEPKTKSKSDLLKKNKATSNTSCAVATCAAKLCSCHFPPAYSQYFECTGHVAGNCNCGNE